MAGFVFATGIENSYPKIANGVRVDEMEKCGHYRRWHDDLALVHEMGLRYLRWGPPLHRVFTGPGQYNWAWTDAVVRDMNRLSIRPIMDLCHFGLPDWLGDFQNTDFPKYFAEYAAECAERYPHIRHWTPVNEILITALFSAKYGWWNERLTTEHAFVRATLNLCRANLLAMREIRRRVPEAIFVQAESCEFWHATHPEAQAGADFENERRFLPLDLTFGHPLSHRMQSHLYDHGMTGADEAFFQHAALRKRCFVGTDYYVTNEHFLNRDGTSGPSQDVLGYAEIARQYYRRYRLPMIHTETNLREDHGSERWLWKQWHCLMQLRREGIPIRGFTWYSLTDQMDWDTALREDARRVNAVGLYDLDRQIRPVGREFARLMGEWSATLAQPAVTRLKIRRVA
ncbi:MAG: family 1 glycosylhydrolase [Gemmataceae bacterium]